MKQRFPRRMIAAAFAAAVMSGCATPGSRDGAGSLMTFSVATYNVENLTRLDRDRDGEADDPKPEEEIDALVRVLRRMRADVVAMQEVGGDAELADLQSRLERKGLRYPYRDVLCAADEHRRLAVLSRFPLVARSGYTNDVFEVGGERFTVKRGIQAVEIEPRAGYRFVLMNVHLKSKRPIPEGADAVREAEAAVARSYVSSLLLENPGINLLVVGDMNDTRNSAALKTLLGKDSTTSPPLTDLRYPDRLGEYWTQYWEWGDVYSRFDYILASPGMTADLVEGRGRIVDFQPTSIASDHRPVQVFFHADDR